MIWTACVYAKQPWPSEGIDSFPALLEQLDATERQYLESQKQRKRQYEFALGRVLTKRLVAEVGGVEVAEVMISLPNDQAPILRVNQQVWQLSIAHSHGAILVAVSRDVGVGADIQWCGKERDLDSIISEFTAFKGIHRDQFYSRWVLLEAYAKLQQQAIADILQLPFQPPSEVTFQLKQTGDYCSAIATSANNQVQLVDGKRLLCNSLQSLLKLEQ